MRSPEVILYMALRSIFPSCSMYTGRPSWINSALIINVERRDLCHLVCFVVILWIVLEDLRLLFVVEVPNQIVYLEFFPPFLTVHKPAVVSANGRKATRSAAYICFASSTSNFLARRNLSYQWQVSFWKLMLRHTTVYLPCIACPTSRCNLIALIACVVEIPERPALWLYVLDAHF